ncbi:MAG TPA: phenylalanine--tRNA ligase subunit beta [Terriglobia bacterium]|nr:phenylalanine--tRNA ligase subunit beta [Terriglobia bacterium]
MKISLNWLREFVDVAVEPRRLQGDLKRLGLGAEMVVELESDWIYDLEITTNRPDCLSHFGVAREAATRYRLPLKPPIINIKETASAAAGAVSIEIAAPDLCARYCGRVIRGVQVKPSPEWLARRLEAMGARPINNVADITNYVLMELGHPLHAFDLAKMRQHKIIVRRVRAGEKLRTLDGVDRTLTAENLVIADAERPVALAGVMGGEDSGISAATRDVLLESAWFDPASIRRTAKAQGLHTEASHRFERGADIEMARVAIDRAAAMIAELARGEVLQGVVDVYPQPKPRSEIILRASEVLRLLGANVPAADVEQILRGLGFAPQPDGSSNSHRWRTLPPSWRLDVTREVDLIEEVARHYGYDRLPAHVRPAPPRADRDTRREKELTISATLVSLGYREIITSSMVDPAENARFTELEPVTLANPLNQEASALRSTTVPSMLRALAWNLDRGQHDARLFEMGKTYTASERTVEGLPGERRVLTLGATGQRRVASVHDNMRLLDLFDLKGDLETLIDAFDVPGLRFEVVACPYYDGGFGGRFLAGSKVLASFGQISHEVREDELRQAVQTAEVDLEHLLSFSLRRHAFRPFSKFPAVQRDFSLLLPEGVTYAQVAEAIRSLGAQEIGSLQPVDLFRGDSLPARHYSLLLRATFQSQTRTLAGEEIEALGARLLAALEPLGVRLRQ